jgi:hypothetical protein
VVRHGLPHSSYLIWGDDFEYTARLLRYDAGVLAGRYIDGPASVAEFDGPRVLDIEATGVIHVTDSGNGRVRKLTPDGVVSTLAGSGVQGFAEGAGPAHG